MRTCRATHGTSQTTCRCRLPTPQNTTYMASPPTITQWNPPLATHGRSTTMRQHTMIDQHQHATTPKHDNAIMRTHFTMTIAVCGRIKTRTCFRMTIRIHHGVKMQTIHRTKTHRSARPEPCLRHNRSQLRRTPPLPPPILGWVLPNSAHNSTHGDKHPTTAANRRMTPMRAVPPQSGVIPHPSQPRPHAETPTQRSKNNRYPIRSGGVHPNPTATSRICRQQKCSTRGRTTVRLTTLG